VAKKKAPSNKEVSRPTIPAHLVGLQAACRDGDSDALLVWADALEEAGDTVNAGVLRQLPHARDVMGREVQDWCDHYPGTGQVSLHVYPDNEEPPYWFCGDREMEGDDATEIVGPLLRQWDQFHPAIEWLVRSLGLLFVRMDTTPRGGRRDVSTSFRLGAGDHLGPLPEGHSFATLWCNQADPGAGGEEDAS
jgi:hypothetical protein